MCMRIYNIFYITFLNLIDIYRLSIGIYKFNLHTFSYHIIFRLRELFRGTLIGAGKKRTWLLAIFLETHPWIFGNFDIWISNTSLV